MGMLQYVYIVKIVHISDEACDICDTSEPHEISGPIAPSALMSCFLGWLHYCLLLSSVQTLGLGP